MHLAKIILLTLVLVISLKNSSEKNIPKQEFLNNNEIKSEFTRITKRSVKSKDITYILYTRASPEGENLEGNHESFQNSKFDPQKRTFIITHGWKGHKFSNSCRLIKDAYLKNGDHDVIVIDWSPISRNRFYPVPAMSVKGVAKQVANMLNYMLLEGLNPKTTTLVGHSLGAHVLGIAAYRSREKFNYIYGLDPAWPNFITAKPGSRISMEDADNVEIIHTNAGRYGYSKSIGHADFYVNGNSKGKTQLGCSNLSCSHKRAYQYFAESINSEYEFCGLKSNFECQGFDECNSNPYMIMGGMKDKIPKPGISYIEVNDEEPFVIPIPECKKNVAKLD